MELKLKKDKLILYFILLSIIFENQLFHIIKIDDIFFKIITVFFIFCSLYIGISSRIKVVNIIVKLYIFFSFIFIFVLQSTYSILILKKSLYGFLAEATRYTYLFAIPSYIYILKSKTLSLLFFKNMKKIIILQFIISLISIVVLLKFGINITNKDFSYRAFGNINVSIYTDTIFIPLIMIFCFYQILISYKKEKIINMVVIVFGVLHSLLITKSRAITLGFLLTAFFMLFICKKYKIIKFFIIISGLIFVVKSKILVKIFHLKEGSFASSNLGHLKAIKESWEYFITHPFLGGGINLDWPVSYCDAGFIGLLANIGIGAIFIYLFPILILVIVSLKKLYKKKSFILAMGYLCFLSLTSFTLIMTDDIRMYGYTFTLSILIVIIEKNINYEFES